MSELPISSPYRSTPDAPVSDAERNRLNQRLNEAFEAGALEADDYRSRLDQLFAAQRLGELVPVVQGLPPLRTYDTPGIVDSGTGQPGEVSEARPAERIALILIAVIGVLFLIAMMLLFIFLD